MTLLGQCLAKSSSLHPRTPLNGYTECYYDHVGLLLKLLSDSEGDVDAGRAGLGHQHTGDIGDS